MNINPTYCTITTKDGNNTKEQATAAAATLGLNIEECIDEELGIYLVGGPILDAWWNDDDCGWLQIETEYHTIQAEKP